MALYEDIIYSEKERTTVIPLCSIKYRAVLMSERSVWNSRAVMNRQDLSAKNPLEIVINTPSPAISNAVQNAVGVIVRELPITAEKVYKGMAEKE